jgi:hypothetical protein
MDACSKWVYSSKIIVLRIFSISYFQKWAGEIAPILVKIKGLLAVLVLNISNYSYLALAPFPTVQQTTCLTY